MTKKVRVILITDGDRVAQKVIEKLAYDLDLRCLSASAGNPTPISGKKIVDLLKTVPKDPVLVMFDDKGEPEKGEGELAMEYVANHPDIEVLGAIAVASNTTDNYGAEVDVCISKEGSMVHVPIDKKGEERHSAFFEDDTIIKGDTVDVINELDIPVVIGIGDIGKMRRKDDICCGAPVTRRAIEEILKRNGIEYDKI
ncbi:stage V sporulation protein AE [Anaerosinus massiliensis]|uniref:stage V sporulation protein AE n=1 Tax=Massilibacillus massiliensis TaxID=1806837 RepID=UPI000A780E15|nr:stage V sporulation protein AE [Massilibacillus massiliensis]